MKRLRSTSRTETGPVRENNEDAVEISDRLVAVADGMGGPPGGEVASSMAVSLVHAAFRGRSLDELEAGVRAANRAIRDRARTRPELDGMGTTICAAGLLDDDRLAIVHVGDTRAYLLRKGSVTQLTDDHSVTAGLVQRGELTEEEARRHPHRGVLTRALGVAPDVELDSATLQVAEGDRLLICTDGLFNELADEEIVESMTGPSDRDATVEGLVTRAISRGGHDNVSVVVSDIAG
jgi:protein phosphatase